MHGPQRKQSPLRKPKPSIWIHTSCPGFREVWPYDKQINPCTTMYLQIFKLKTGRIVGVVGKWLDQVARSFQPLLGGRKAAPKATLFCLQWLKKIGKLSFQTDKWKTLENWKLSL